MDQGKERLIKLLQATPPQLEQIDQILAGKLTHMPPHPSSGSLLLGMGQAAELLGVSRPTLWRLIQAGRLQKLELLPNSYRIRRTDIEAFVRNEGEK